MNASAFWSHGPRCGVQNCRSRLWRTVNGQRVCQNGHIREGDIELADDDETFFTQGGRTMTMGGRSTQTEIEIETKRLYGKEGHLLAMRCLQVVVRAQVRWLIEHQNAPPELEKVARSLFGIWADSLSSTSTLKLYETGGNDDGQNSRAARPKFSISIINTISITFLSCTVLRLPIYIYDITRWVAHYKFPYASIHNIVPKDMMDKLGMDYRKAFVTYPRLSGGTVYLYTRDMAQYFAKHYQLRVPPTLIEPLLFKIVRDLFLPPEVYSAALKLLKVCDVTADWTKPGAGSCQPEGDCFAAVFLCAKLCYGLDDIKRIPKRDTEPAHQIVDWELWESMVRKVWVEDEAFGQIKGQDPLTWDDAKVDRFLNWMDKCFLQSEEVIETAEEYSHLKRYLQIFPRQRAQSTETAPAENHVSQLIEKGFYADAQEEELLENPIIDLEDEYEEFEMVANNELRRKMAEAPRFGDQPNPEGDYDVYPSLESILEITQLVQSTTSSYDVHLTKHDKDEDDWSDMETEPQTKQPQQQKKPPRKVKGALYKGVKVRPGERYPSEKTNWSVGYAPLLIEAGKRMTGENLQVLERLIRQLERKLVKLAK